MDDRCPFTGSTCDGGAIYGDGSIGCVFGTSPERCSLLADVPDNETPRDFYNRMLMEVCEWR